MNIAKTEGCPDQQTLLEFLQGRLAPPKLGQCESHLSDCVSCHETLRGLDTSDTLSHYVAEALEDAESASNVSDTQAIDGLMQRLLQPNPQQPFGQRPAADVEIMADRAAEVLRCIAAPSIGDDDSLGTLGDYQLLRLIGAGGTGVVFMAKDTTLDRLVALKVLRPSLGELARDRFMAEARLAASIEHDNIVTIYQIGQQDRLAFIAMQWLPGETLESRLVQESGLLDEETVRDFVGQIAAGLSAAHERQLIHRDIKPANIWICEDTDRIKILDFGLARVTDEDSSFTQTGMLAGTPNFMSPEQARGLELDSRSDLFSLGCVMYQMLAGKLPFSAPTILATLQTIQTESPQPPIAAKPECDQDLSDLTMSLLEKLPGNRLASAQNLIACLETDRAKWPEPVTIVSGKALAAGFAHAEASSSSQRSSSGGLRWIAAIALLGLIGLTGWLMAPQIFRIVTDQGELVIETDDPNIKIEVRENGNLFRVLDTSTDESFDIQSGNYVFNAIKEGSESEFEITPKSVTMTRGGRKVVSVTISDASAQPLDSAEIFSDGEPPINENSKARDRVQFEATIAAMEAERDTLRRRLGSGHPSTQALEEKMASMKKHFEPIVFGRDVPIYGGRTFEQWMQIAKYDREPKTLADAIAACGFLAEGDNKESFIALLRQLVRQHGKATSELTTNGGSNANDPANIYFTAFHTAVFQLDNIEIVNFIQREIESGNENSLGFCGGLLANAFFDGNIDTIREFRKQLKLNINPLLKRICEGKVELNTNLQSFLGECFRQAKTEVDVSLCKQAINTLDVQDRPWVYSIFLIRFPNGELDKLIESDFLADSTDGETRESFVWTLEVSNPNPNFGGGGLATAPVPMAHQRALLNRLLLGAMARMFNDEEPNLKFKRFERIYFTEDRVIPTSLRQDGELLWQQLGGNLTDVKPEGMQETKGTAAIVRHLLSKLCQQASNRGLESDQRDALKTFARKLTQSNKAYKDLAKTKEFEDLKINEDLKALMNVVKGEYDRDKFSRFAKPESNRFGGGGGGGVF